MMSYGAQVWFRNLIGVTVILIGLPVTMWFFGVRPPTSCEMSAFNVSITIDGQSVEEGFSLENPIPVKQGASLAIRAEAQTQPGECEGDFSINWVMLLVSRLSQVKNTTIGPTSELLELTIDDQPQESAGVDLITVTVFDTLQKKKAELIIPLEVKGG